MHPILLYLLKMLLCSGILYGYYRVALYNERFHQWNRFYLLGAMLLSLVVPLLEIQLVADEQPKGLVYVIETLPATIVAKATPWFTAEQLVWVAVLLVSLVLFTRLAWGLYLTIYKPYRNGDVSTREDIDVVVTETPSAPYSFFRLLFWRSDMDPDSPHGKRVLLHELTHIREKHSADKLFVEMLLVVCWFNPFFWLIRKELYVIHEFLADRKAIEQNNGAAFAEMILQTMNAGHLSPLTNPFFSSQIKRRLKMITTSDKPQFSYLRRISALAAMVTLSIVLMLTIEKGMAQQAPPPPPPPPPPPAAPAPPPPPPKISLPDSIKSIEVNTVNGQSMITIRLKNGKVRKMPVDEAIKNGYPVPPPPPPPPPPAAPNAPIAPKATGTEMVLPEGVKSIEVFDNKGHCMVKVILQNGKTQTMPLQDAVKKGYPIPSASSGTVTEMPVLTALAPLSNSTGGINVNLDGLPSLYFNPGTEPLFVYAGLVISQEQVNKINPNDIESIDVLKGESATKLYGDKAKNGVIRITPKAQAYTQQPPNGKVYEEVVVTGYAKNPQQKSGANSSKWVKGFPLDNPPLFVLDGRIISGEEMSGIDPANIARINVLKDKKATELYGEKGKNGVVEIELKKAPQPL